MKILIFLTVAPLLYWGIFLIAEESLATHVIHRVRESKSFFNRQARGIEQDSFVLVAIILAITGIVFVSWKDFNIFWIYFIAVAISFSLLQMGKAKREQRRWKKRVDSELPGIIQALTLMISAGVSPIRAMQAISNRSSSVVADELRHLVGEVMDGKSTVKAIDDFARRIDSAASRRFSNALSVAIERGTPLVPVLTALLKDSQVHSRNELLRRAGKAEIALMLPVVFLLLPISVLFALFPSLTQLQSL